MPPPTSSASPAVTATAGAPGPRLRGLAGGTGRRRRDGSRSRTGGWGRTADVRPTPDRAPCCRKLLLANGAEVAAEACSRAWLPNRSGRVHRTAGRPGRSHGWDRVPGFAAPDEVIDEVADAGQPEDGPDETAEAVPVPAPDPAAQAGQPDQGGDQCPGHPAAPPAGGRLLHVDPAVGFGQQRPGEAVQQHPDPGEDSQDDEDAADDQGVDAQPLRDAAGNAAYPAVASAVNPLASDPVEKGLRLAAAERRRRAVGRRAVVRRWGRAPDRRNRPEHPTGRWVSVPAGTSNGTVGDVPAGTEAGVSGPAGAASDGPVPAAERDGSWLSSGCGVCGFILRSSRLPPPRSTGDHPEPSLSRPRFGLKTGPGDPDPCLD